MKGLIVKTSLAVVLASGVGYSFYLDEAKDQAKVEQLQVKYELKLNQNQKLQKNLKATESDLKKVNDSYLDMKNKKEELQALNTKQELKIKEHSEKIQRQSEQIAKLQKQTDESPSVGSSGWITFEASAYTTAANGDAYVSAKWGNKTASGTTPTQGRTIAVDRHLIPLGTKLLVKFPEPYSYLDGTYTAEDTGNGIKGYEVDLFLNSHSACINFGVRDIKIKKL